jgi:hypothetical protein
MSYFVVGVAFIDRLISLLLRREAVNRATFNDTLAPAMASIDEVHKNYLESFARYRQGLKDASVHLDSSHPLFDSIKEDNLQSEHLRSKVSTLEPWLKDEKFGAFLSAIHAYLSNASEPVLTTRTFPLQRKPEDIEKWDAGRAPQMIRTGYERKLKTILEDTKDNDDHRRKRALAALDAAVDGLQERYHQVRVAYAELQKKLLAPK